jgi:hypothetical protein
MSQGPRSLRGVLYAKEGEGISKNGGRADTLFLPLQKEEAIEGVQA